jgi:putative SOS response-associated peptidase YedK
MFNARAETLAASPAFRDSLRRKRCLVPVESFYEWRREGAVRQPYSIGRADGRPLVLAGLWSGWRDPRTDTVRRTFTIVTTRPNETMAEIHDRMPVMLDDAVWATWLDPTLADPGELMGLLEPGDGPELLLRPVSQLVNNVRNDGPELVVPLAG